MGRGAGRKIVQNAFFHGKRHDNRILKVKILLSRNFVVMAQAPKTFEFDTQNGPKNTKKDPENDLKRLRTFCKYQARKRNPNLKLLSPDIFWWGGGLPREGVGAKKFGMSLETQGIKLFWRDIPGFRRDIPGAPEKFEKKRFGFNFWPPKDPENDLKRLRTFCKYSPSLAP